MTDLTTYTPHDVARLVPDAQRVLQAATQDRSAPGRLYNAAADLAAFVGSPGFAQHGNYLSAPIQRMMKECP